MALGLPEVNGSDVYLRSILQAAAVLVHMEDARFESIFGIVYNRLGLVKILFDILEGFPNIFLWQVSHFGGKYFFFF